MHERTSKSQDTTCLETQHIRLLTSIFKNLMQLLLLVSLMYRRIPPAFWGVAFSKSKKFPNNTKWKWAVKVEWIEAQLLINLNTSNALSTRRYLMYLMCPTHEMHSTRQFPCRICSPCFYASSLSLHAIRWATAWFLPSPLMLVAAPLTVPLHSYCPDSSNKGLSDTFSWLKCRFTILFIAPHHEIGFAWGYYHCAWTPI